MWHKARSLEHSVRIKLIIELFVNHYTMRCPVIYIFSFICYHFSLAFLSPSSFIVSTSPIPRLLLSSSPFLSSSLFFFSFFFCFLSLNIIMYVSRSESLADSTLPEIGQILYSDPESLKEKKCFSMTIKCRLLRFDGISTTFIHKTVLFQTIQFSLSTQFSSIWHIDKTLSGATTEAR